MDPLSISASIITLIQAAGVVARGVRALRSIKNAPAEFYALCNEVATLQAAIEQVRLASESMAHRGSFFQAAASEPIRKTLYNIENVGVEFDQFAARLLATTKDPPSSTAGRIHKLTWFREKHTMAMLREKARFAREQLLLCFSSINSSET